VTVNAEHLPYIDHCLQIAQRGRGRVGHNPLVGAVLVRFDRALRDKGRIIAEAFHAAFGAAHAERKLLEGFKGDIEPDDILYVNLEPCVHHGKTPPCTDIIIERGVKQVVFGMTDPNPLVKEKSRRALEEAKIKVTGPIDSVRCRRLNRGFVSLHEQSRPWITLKRAQTRDGGISGKITRKEQDAWSHAHLRGKHDAILVGVGTIIHDDPQLTNRSVTLRKNSHHESFQPRRIVLDPQLRTPIEANVVSEGTTIITSSTDRKLINEVEAKGVTVLGLSLRGDNFAWEEVWAALPDVSSILVEGGAETWRRFQEASLVDEEVTLVQ